MVQKKTAQKTVQKTVQKTEQKTAHNVMHKMSSVAKSTGKWLCQPRVSVIGLLVGILAVNFFPIPVKWAAKIGYLK